VLHDQLKLRVLGPVEVNVSGRWFAPGPPKQRALLVALALNAGRTVSMRTLMETLWVQEPPPSAVKNVQLYVWKLRQLLGELLLFQPPGYCLAADSVELDADQFSLLANLARRAQCDGNPGAARQYFAEALGLWRGPALADLVESGLATDLARPLAAERTRVIHEFVELELTAGRVDDLLPRLDSWVADDPLNERLREQQLQALLDAHRPAEALSAYVAAESVLAVDLGTGPGEALREMARSARAAMTAAPKDLAVPHQLPPAVATFVGRRKQIATLVDLLSPRVRSVPVVAIVGPGGIGKSALGIRVAHHLADTFADGQLYVDLQGTTPGLDPVAATEALSALLRGLGVAAEDVPSGLAEAVRRYRSQTAGRSLLVVLDNAADAAQVGPLVPATGGSAVLITTRRSLTELDGVTLVHLDTLPANEAIELLATTLGRQRVTAEPDEEVRALIEACGGFPLALRVAAARLASRPSWSLEAFNKLLRDERGRLNELRLADTAVRTSFALSYQHLAPEAQQVFRCCGLFPGPDFATAAIAALANLDAPKVADHLEELVDASLLNSSRPGRYHLHDLIRIYGAECAHEYDDQRATDEKFARLAAWYLMSADLADRCILPARGRIVVEAEVVDLPAPPDLHDREQALAWFEAERRNLRGVVRESANRDLHRVASQLPAVMRGFLELRRYTDDLIATYQMALASVRHCDDPLGLARVLNGLGTGYWLQERMAEAIDCYQQALATAQASGDRRVEAIMLSNLGAALGEARDFDMAIACLREGLEIHVQMGNQEIEQSSALTNLGHVYHECGRFDEALPLLEQALRLRQNRGNRKGQGATLHCIADTLLGLGRAVDADDAVRQALRICSEQGDRYGQAAALHTLGRVRVEQGRPGEAIPHLRQAIRIYGEIGTTRDAAKAEGDLLRAGAQLDGATDIPDV
jgi:DNA-binding SARP family transcriptional activator/tetratricopeptide (TPR) repeat protein